MGVPQIIQSLDNVNIESHDDSGNTILRKPRVILSIFLNIHSREFMGISMIFMGNSWDVIIVGKLPSDCFIM